jgi:hypothetical protein
VAQHWKSIGCGNRSVGDLNTHLTKSPFAILELLSQLPVLPFQAIGVASNHGSAIVTVGCLAGVLGLLTRRASARVAIALDLADLGESVYE